MKTFLSFGGGVNSVALYILLNQKDIEFEAVYADHGADWPETRDYVKWMNENGYPVTILETKRDGLNLYNYYWKYRWCPIRILRHCTDHFKIKPLKKYFGQFSQYRELIGFDASEPYRARPDDKEYPLMEWGITRDDCVKIIKKEGWQVPIKSGCFLCPFQTVGQWEKLSKKHPDLLQKAIDLEERNNQRNREQGKPEFYVAHDIPIKVASSGKHARKMWLAEQKGQTNIWSKLKPLDQCPYCLV